MDSLAEVAHKTVMKKGRVTMTELSSSFKLPVDVIQELISARVCNSSTRFSEPSKIVNQALVTEIYEQDKKNVLCALCNAVTQPCSVQELMRACHMQEEEEEMATELLKDLTKDAHVQGSLTSVRKRECRYVYVPDAFIAAQHDAAYTFFSVNGYLDLATATAMQVRRLHPFVKDNNPDAVCLETVAVSRAMVEQLNAVADEAVVRRSWFEAWMVIPLGISQADAAHLVGMCSACQRAEDDPLRVLQMDGVYGVSNAFVEDIMGHFRREISSSATCPSSASVGEPSPRGAGAPRKGKERRKGGRKMNDAVLDLPEDEVESFISSCKPDLGDHPRLVLALGAHLAHRFRDAKMEAKRLAKEMSAGNVNSQADAFDATLESEYLALQLFGRGVQALRDSLRHRKTPGNCSRLAPGIITSATNHSAFDTSIDTAAVQRGKYTQQDNDSSHGRRAEVYLLKTKGAGLAAIITARECEKLGIAFAAQDKAQGKDTERMPSITMEARSALVEVLPQDVGRALGNLWQAALDGDSLGSFCEILQEQIFPACNLVGRRLDKRKERQLLAEEERVMKGRLFRSESEDDVLHLATLLVFQHVKGALPLLPRPHVGPSERELHPVEQDMKESWSGVVLSALRGLVPSETELVLSNLQWNIADQVGDANANNASPRSTDRTDLEMRNLKTDSSEEVKSEEMRIDRGECNTTRLMKSIEAARALGLECGD
ncbi:unnamed protein product [Ascophyllum nodosum]